MAGFLYRIPEHANLSRNELADKAIKEATEETSNWTVSTKAWSSKWYLETHYHYMVEIMKS